MIPIAWMAVAAAHEPGLSRAEISERAITLRVARADVASPPTLLDGTRVSTAAGPCSLGPTDVRVDDDGFLATAPLSCPAGDRWTVTAGWFAGLPAGHQTVLERDGAPVAWLDAGHPATTVQTRASAGRVAWGYLALGVAHILTGWDHLLFLFGLLLVARTAREVFGIVTGFTLAHSVTLALAALDVVRAPAGLVEPAIGLTLLWVGVDNLRDRPGTRRFWWTSALGLVHGLGFAGVLSEIGLPEGQVPFALVAFNGGVELGQAAVVAAAYPLLVAARRVPAWRTYGVRLGSVGVAVAGAALAVSRCAAG